MCNCEKIEEIKQIIQNKQKQIAQIKIENKYLSQNAMRDKRLEKLKNDIETLQMKLQNLKECEDECDCKKKKKDDMRNYEEQIAQKEEEKRQIEKMINDVKTLKWNLTALIDDVSVIKKELQEKRSKRNATIF